MNDLIIDSRRKRDGTRVDYEREERGGEERARFDLW